MAPGETSGTFERVTFATTTLRSPRGPSAVATKRPALAGLPALAAGATEYVKPAIGAKAWPPLPKAVAHCPTTSFWKLTTPGPLATWRASEIADSATKCTWTAPRKLRVASTFAVPMSSALATRRRSVPMAKSATASAKPVSRGRLGVPRCVVIWAPLQTPERAAPDRDLGADLRGKRPRIVRVGVRKDRPQREADTRHAVALRGGQRRRRPGGHELDGRVAPREVAQDEASAREPRGEHHRRADTVGAAQIGADQLVGEVLVRGGERAVAVQVLLEADAGGGGVREPAPHARARGTRRDGEGGAGRVVARHADLPAHQVEHAARRGLDVGIRGLRPERLLLSEEDRVKSCESDQGDSRRDQQLGGREPTATCAHGPHGQGIVLQRT